MIVLKQIDTKFTINKKIATKNSDFKLLHNLFSYRNDYLLSESAFLPATFVFVALAAFSSF